MNGYAHRSHEILSAQQASNEIEVHALTSPWYPERKTLDNALELDGITYHRCLHPALLPSSGGVFKRLAARRGRKKRERYNSNMRGIWIFKAMLEPFALLTEEKIISKHFVE